MLFELFGSFSIVLPFFSVIKSLVVVSLAVVVGSKGLRVVAIKAGMMGGGVFAL